MLKILFAILLFAQMTFIYAENVNVYFGTGGKETKGIYRAVFNTSNGKLTKVQLAAEIRSPGFLAMNSSKTHLYAVGSFKEPVVAAYAIKKDGSLEFVNSIAIGDGGAAHIAVHPSDKFLLTAQYGGGSVASFSINEDGSLNSRIQLMDHEGGSKVVPKRQDSPHPHWVGFSPDAKYAFVPDLGLDQIEIYKVTPGTNMLQPHSSAITVPGGGPRHMRFSVDGKYIYLLNELTLSVSTFAYDANSGTAIRTTTTKALPDIVKSKEAFNSSSEILVHPNGKFVYSANRGNDSVTVYHAEPETGFLRVQEVESIRGSWPRNINLDPTAKWLLAAGAHSNTISVFSVDQDNGELTFQTRNIAQVPGSICILFGK